MTLQNNLRILESLLIIFASSWLLYAYIFLIKNAPAHVIVEILIIATICAFGSALVEIIRRHVRKKTHSESDFNVP